MIFIIGSCGISRCERISILKRGEYGNEEVMQMIPSSLPPLSDEQRAKIAANRARALELQAKKRAEPSSVGASNSGPVTVPTVAQSTVQTATVAAAAARPPLSVQQPQPIRSLSDGPRQEHPAPVRTNTGPLTAEQLAQIQKNREAALARRAAAAMGTQPASSSSSITVAAAPEEYLAPVASSAAPPAVPSPPKAPFFRSTVEATIVVHSSDRFRVVMSPYHSSITTAMRIVPSRSWDEKLKVNTFLFQDLHVVYKILSEIKEANVQVVRLPENVYKILTKPDTGGRLKTKVNPTGDLTSGIDPGLISVLFPFQKKGVEFGIKKEGRLMIADEMGLGKSIQALAIARYFKHEFPLAIVCPASVKSAWKLQIQKFCPAVKENLYILEKEKDPLPGVASSNTVVIMSYDFLKRKQKELLDAHYGVWIFDESHYLKDYKAQRTKAATAIAKNAKRVILLSGTPALSRPSELFTQIRLIDSNLFTNANDFLIRYCDGKETSYGLQGKGATNSEELSIILKKRIMIRRLKSEVLEDLPEKMRELVYISSAEIKSRIHKSGMTSSRAFDNGGWDHSDPTLMEYYMSTGTAKAPSVCEHVIDNYFYDGSDDTRKILVFGHHQIVLDTIEHNLSQKGINCIRIDGKTPSHKRGALCDKFQKDPSVRVAVLSITAAGEGITLTAASVVVFAEIYWIPGKMQQAEDRAHRVGQKNSVVVQYMLAKETADDLIWPLIGTKIEILAQVNLNSEKFTNAERKDIDADNYNWNVDDDDDIAPSTTKKRKV